MGLLKNIINKLKGKDRFSFQKVGFHGNKHLIGIIDALLQNRVENFIETGTNVGSTLDYVSKRAPQVKCYSCEPDMKAYRLALSNVNEQNVNIYNEFSQEFLEKLGDRLSDLRMPGLFWLDAHGYGFEWPLKFEINFIMSNFTSFFIIIDDFKVPAHPKYNYDNYDGQECSFEYIKSSIPKGMTYYLYYPNYPPPKSEQNSRGWGIIASEPLSLPEDLMNLVSLA